MTKYFLMGFDSKNQLMLLTRRIFDDLPSAIHYQVTVSPTWNAFIASTDEPINDGQSTTDEG